MRNIVQHFLQKEVDRGAIPGAVIHVARHGKTLLDETVGFKTVYPERREMASDTIFDLASLTKVVATLPAVLKLLDCGEVRLDDRVSFFLPAFSSNGKEQVRIRHLLTHTSGLPAHRHYYAERLTEEQIVARICEEIPEAPPGKQVVYSDLGFIILYRLIEQITGEKFADFVRQEIFEPLGMTETGFCPAFAKNRYAATEYSETLKQYKLGIVHDENAEAMGGISGHAGLFSTGNDLQRFAAMMENNGHYQKKQMLSAVSVELSRNNFTPGAAEYRGLGWALKNPEFSSCGDLFSESSYGHTGFTGTSIWFDPSVSLRVILLTNRVHLGRHDDILRLRPRLHNLIRSRLG
ncbi:CubicO group peptidase, beta-lactamase class C family [Evansella caseinilytica]|uniref:CubicO group peptidase, beta-lactamase class C family n=1 Tax=Evansella caseinilytica TaxID=1503961 RepID=A0A1H3IYT9_9BACI|nr:serine hydrolase domain-containing protein [Evansella caseinilytica]SDY32074.1 CubicO group peptidase, beta-lactamase class C family [Evansella caseinilytica]